MMKILGPYHSLKCSVMKRIYLIVLLLLPLSVFSQSFTNDLKFSAFIGEGMGTGFGLSTNLEKKINYSLNIGFGEFIYKNYNSLFSGNYDYFGYKNCFQYRISIPSEVPHNKWYLYNYSSIIHFSIISDFLVFNIKNIEIELCAGMQLRWFANTTLKHYDFDTLNGQIMIYESIDDKLINKKYHTLNFGFISTAKVSFFNNKKFSPFLSYGGFVDVIDATKFRWLHVFQVGVSYNWQKSVEY